MSLAYRNTQPLAFRLEIENLTFRFHDRPIFSTLSLRANPGVYWLRGRNGAGKTTLLKLIAGALTPDFGTLRVNGFDSATDAVAYRKLCFYCGGETPELAWLSARQFIDLHLSLFPGVDQDVLNGHLTEFGVEAVMTQGLRSLSLGQYKKLQLAIALALPVQLLLLDEPLNGLDLPAIEYLRKSIGSLAEGKKQCVILTSHVEPKLPAMSEIDLDSGRII